MQRFAQLAGLVTFIPALCHELTHWGVARTQTDDAAFAVEVYGCRAEASWPPLDSRLVRATAFLAPTVLGTMLAVAWLISGAPIGGWRLILLAALAVYTMPSPRDVRGALGLQPAQQENHS